MAPDPAVVEQASQQEGALSRVQAVQLGPTPGQVRHLVRSGRWQPLHPGVYATFTGTVSARCRVWAAILLAGPGAAASHGTAAWLCGLHDDEPPTVHVLIPAHQRVSRTPGITVHVSRHAEVRCHPGLSLPQTRVEDTVLDLTDAAVRTEDAVAVVIRACQRRLTTPGRLRTSAARRSRLRHRRLLAEVLTDVDEGVQSILERRWLRDVERPHGLPPGCWNRAERVNGGTRYRDVDYPAWRVVVELDGRVAHPAGERHRDMARDNALAAQARLTLRYGWVDVTRSPCAVADQVARTLRAQGWSGPATQCGSGCTITTS